MTKEDLEQIDELLYPIHKKLDSLPTRQEVIKIVQKNNKILETIFKVELAEFKKAVLEGFKAMAKETKVAIHTSEERVKAEIYATRIKDLEKRIEFLERHADFHQS